MAKHKKKVLPDRVNQTKPKKDVKKNPFEVKLNRQKHQVINRKFKCERGLPGVARDRAILKRKETLLKEYVHRNKDNVLLDRRIGEGDANLDPDEKIARRIARESTRKNKRNLFNLNDDEVLTHLGQSIEDVNAADDPRSDDEDIYDKLDAAFVGKAHFGGFLTKAEGTEESRRRAIGELIAETKRLKHERQIEVDENVKLTEALDLKWKNVSSLLASVRSGASAKSQASSDKRVANKDASDVFDMLVSELQYAPRAGIATDRTKNPEEVAKEERERLEELERRRLARARGEDDSNGSKRAAAKHRSADDLDDGFAIEDNNDDGDPNGEAGTDDDNGCENAGSDADEIVKNSEDEEKPRDEDGSESDTAPEDKDGEEDNGEEEQDEDSYDDLKSDSEDEITSNAQATTQGDTSVRIPRKATTAAISLEALTNDIPYLIAVPENMDVFDTVIQNRTYTEELIIVERIITGNAPSLHEGNKRRLEGFLRLLIDRIFVVLDEAPIGDGGVLPPGVLQLVNGLVVHIYRLTEMSPVASARSFIEIVRNIYRGERSKGPKKDSSFPGLERLIMFKLISICFSASDQKHAVATPALLCMAHLLTTCRVNDGRNMLRGIFLAQLMLEYVAFGEKYVPEVISFILRLLNESQRLTLSGVVREQDLRLRLSDLYCSRDLELPRTVRCKIMFGLLNLINVAADVFSKVPSFAEVFSTIHQRLGKLESSYYPESLKSLLTTVITKLSRDRPRGPLCRKRSRPQMLKMYEPLIEEKVDLLRKVHNNSKGAKVETKKLQAKYKKELKSAMREVRRDNQFIAHHKLKEQLRLDHDRKMKVKRLFGELATQQGELNSLQKLKGKKK